MRKTEFRGKPKSKEDRKKYGEWIKGGLVEDTIHFRFKCYDEDGDELNILMNTKVIPETVGQFTNLEDEDGTKIYEGDLLDYDRGIWEVRPSSSGAWLISFSNGAGECTLSMRCGDCALVGNIHDDPNLIN